MGVKVKVMYITVFFTVVKCLSYNNRIHCKYNDQVKVEDIQACIVVLNYHGIMYGGKAVLAQCSTSRRIQSETR